MKKFSKIISVLMVFVMVLSLFCGTALSTSAKSRDYIKLNKSCKTLYIGKSFTLKVKKASSKKLKKVIWKSSKKSVATVSKSGKVKAKKKGSCKIIAISKKNKKVKAVCYIKVLGKVSKSLNKSIINTCTSITSEVVSSEDNTYIEYGVVSNWKPRSSSSVSSANSYSSNIYVSQAMPENCMHRWIVISSFSCCGMEGVIKYTCSKCGARRTENTPPISHSFGSILCKRSGGMKVYYQRCSKCGMEKIINIE